MSIEVLSSLLTFIKISLFTVHCRKVVYPSLETYYVIKKHYDSYANFLTSALFDSKIKNDVT